MTTVLLMNRDNPVLRAEYDREIHAFTDVTGLCNPSLAPFGAREADGSVSRRRLQGWWSARSIPTSWDDLERLQARLGGHEPMDLIERRLGLSLTDQFWVKPEADDRSWQDVNFFTNGIADELGYTLASPYGPVLMKAGSSPLYLEPYSELAATRMYERVLAKDEFVPHSLALWSGRQFSCFQCLVAETECFIPMRDILNSSELCPDATPWVRLLSCCESLGLTGCEETLSKVFVCDFILANPGRNWGNLGVIFDAETMVAKRIAPIYDSGAALWSRVAILEDDRDFWYRPSPLMPESGRRVSPEDQLRIIKDLDWLDLSRLDGFVDELAGILSSARFTSEERVSRICEKVLGNLRHVAAYKDSVARRSPSIASGRGPRACNQQREGARG